MHAVRNGRSFLVHLQGEIEASVAAGEALFKVRPKLHYWSHSLDHCLQTKENPSRYDCFDWESFVGRIKRIVAKTHRLQASARTVHRYLLQCAVRWNRGYLKKHLDSVIPADP